MSDAKEEADRQKARAVTTLNRWQAAVHQSVNTMDELQKVPDTEISPKHKVQLQNTRERLFDTFASMQRMEDNLDQLKNYYEYQKSVFDLRRFAFDSWPESLYLKQMLWVSTILFSLGGAAFTAGAVTTDGEFGLWLSVPGVFWLFGGGLILNYLSKLKHVDRQKMEYYAREFDMGEDLRQIAIVEVCASGEKKETRYRPRESMQAATVPNQPDKTHECEDTEIRP